MIGKPYSKNEHFITPNMLKNIIFQTFLQIIIVCTILFQCIDLLDIGSKAYGISRSVGDKDEEVNKNFFNMYNYFSNPKLIFYLKLTFYFSSFTL